MLKITLGQGSNLLCFLFVYVMIGKTGKLVWARFLSTKKDFFSGHERRLQRPSPHPNEICCPPQPRLWQSQQIDWQTQANSFQNFWQHQNPALSHNEGFGGVHHGSGATRNEPRYRQHSRTPYFRDRSRYRLLKHKQLVLYP